MKCTSKAKWSWWNKTAIKLESNTLKSFPSASSTNTLMFHWHWTSHYGFSEKFCVPNKQGCFALPNNLSSTIQHKEPLRDLCEHLCCAKWLKERHCTFVSCRYCVQDTKIPLLMTEMLNNFHLNTFKTPWKYISQAWKAQRKNNGTGKATYQSIGKVSSAVSQVISIRQKMNACSNSTMHDIFGKIRFAKFALHHKNLTCTSVPCSNAVGILAPE